MAASSSQHRSRFGDTTLTKVFVGGLAWETPTDELRHYFEQFGEILEAVVITDKNTGRSKGYGFVTFKDPDSARRAVEDPNPVIDGRQANCNIASMGRPRPTPAPPRGRNQMEGLHQGPPRATGPPQYSRVREQMPSPAVFYNPQIGFMTYPAEYSYQQGFYNPQVTPQYYHQMYGPTSPSTLGSPYYYTNMGYMPNPRAGFLSPQQGPRPLYIQYPAAQMERPFTPSLPDNFQLQPPPNARPPTNTMDSQASQPSSAAGDT